MAVQLHREYPHLSFRKNWSLTGTSQFLLGQCAAFVSAINNTPIMPKHYQELMNVSLIKGAQATTAIEGNTLSDDDIKRMLAGDKMPPSKEYQEIEVRNILDAFNELLQEVIANNETNLISADLLRRFQRMVGKGLGEHFAAIPGQFRNNDVVVGNYRCPDYRDVPVLVDEFCKWLRDEFGFEKQTKTFSEVVIQAIVSHIYIEWIHPFGDGNGRTGRLVEFYILLRGGNPDIASHILSNHYNQTRANYYRQIEKATSTNDLTGFIEYALLGFRDGLKQTLETIQKSQFVNSWQKLIYDKFDGVHMNKKDVFKRQRALALELPMEQPFSLLEVPDLSIKLARFYSNLSERTLARDIEKLLELELIVKDKGKYIANTGLLKGLIAKKRTAR
ncbi:Fic family protein [Parasediminibacterium sp. JCM 36343]|uniref:Fic family protein n=1 Tax=Parasediminibacterium sp. JCM 36343 TaxID=3374279 RepID=UPI00397D17E7